MYVGLEKEFFPFFSFSSFCNEASVLFLLALSFIQFTTMHPSTEDDIHLLVKIFEGLRHIEHKATPGGRTAAGVKFAGCTLHTQRLRVDRRTAFLGSDYTTPP